MIETKPDDLRAALGVERWVADLSAASPFDSLEDLLATAHMAATPLAPSEVDDAIAHHPRTGARPDATGDAETNDAIAAGSAAYERRFGRTFIIRAAGRSRTEILGELERRLALPPEEESPIVGEQLRDIALLRLENLYAEEA